MPGRRLFVSAVASALAGLRCGGAAGPTDPLAPPRPAPRTIAVPLMAVGETVAVFDGDLLLAVTRLTAGTVAAVSRVCTHQGCTVLLPAAAAQTLDCPCHGSRFTTAGSVVQGPATRALASYPARIEGGQVLVTVG